MKFTNIASFLALCLLPCAAATATTPQLMDELVLGGKRYHIYQVPMLGYWDYGDGSIGKGQVKPPHFDFSSTANSAGYQATWEITDSKLKLRRITGRIDGRRVKNRKIIDKNSQSPPRGSPDRFIYRLAITTAQQASTRPSFRFISSRELSRR